MISYKQYLNEEMKMDDWQLKNYNSQNAYDFAIKYNVRVPEFEARMKYSAGIAYHYAKNILKKRWRQAEPSILEHLEIAIRYAIDVVKARWPAFEEEWIWRGRTWRKNSAKRYLDYYNFLALKYTSEDQISWLEKEGFSDYLFDILNGMWMDKKVQEYIIEKRPDLISKIENLDPSLKIGHKHELGLSGIEI